MARYLDWHEFRVGDKVKNRHTGEIGYVVEIWYNNIFAG